VRGDHGAAWHAGVVDNPTATLVTTTYRGINPNYWAVGIEHEGMSGDPFPETQYAATLWLHKQILSEFPGIVVDADHLIPHHTINAGHAGCPGSTFPLGRLLADLQSWAVEVHRGNSA